MLFPFQEVGKSRENVRNVAEEKVPTNFVAGHLFFESVCEIGKSLGTSPLCYLLRELLMLCTRTEFLHRLRGISSFLSKYFILPDVNRESRVIVNRCMHSLNILANLR